MRTILPQKDNPLLRQPARDVPIAEIGSARIQTLIGEMKALLAREKFGVALAAPQIGEPLRIFVVSGRALARGSRDASDMLHEEDGERPEPTPLPDQVYINPVMTKMSRRKTGKHEGCLSIRGTWGIVPRAEKVTITAYDENGMKLTRGASGFLAHIFQHEMDHLEGILYTDKATELYDESEPT